MTARIALALVAVAAFAPRDASADDLRKLGETTYNQTCVACHLPNGKGIDKVNPPLAGSDWVTGDDTDKIIRVVLHGLQGAVTVSGQPYFGLMPGHAPMLNDEQIAGVLTYVRSSWGNKAGAIDPKRVAAVRAAYPGQTTPWTTDELKAPVPDAPVAPAGSADKPLLSELTYRYYEGQWSKLPDFEKLKPAAVGELPDGLITIAPAKKKNTFAMVFAGTLTVPSAGVYAFNLASDDGSRLIIDGKIVVDNDSVHPHTPKAGKTQLTAGSHKLEVQYFEALGDESLSLVISGPGIGTRSLSPGGPANASNDDPAYYLLASDRPLVVRANLPGTSTRSLAVGLLNGINYVFDTTTCSVRYAWFGQFLDVGDNRGKGRGRGGADCRLLGDQFNVGDTGAGLVIGAGDQAVDFKGYARSGDAPTLMYTVNGVGVKQTVRGATGGLGVEYTFELDKTPDAPVTFTVNPTGLKLDASAGQWVDGKLTVPAKDASKFSVTLLVDRK